MSTIPRTLRGILALSAVAATACSDSTGPGHGSPAGVERVSASHHQGVAGSALADQLAIRVTDAGGNAVPGAGVTWAVATGDGSVTPAVGSTDAEGEARAAWVLGTAAGSQSVTATVSGLPPVTFSATAIAGPTASLASLAGGGQTGPAGCTLEQLLAVRALDQFGNLVAGAAIDWSVTAGGGAVVPEALATDEDGIARATWRLGEVAGAQSVSASTGGATADFAATAGEPAPAFSGSMEVDYAGDDDGTFSSSSSFRFCPAGLSTNEWAFSFHEPVADEQYLIASSPRSNGATDVIFIIIEGAVTAPGTIDWDFDACQGGDSAMCGADGLIALNIPAGASVDDAERIYFFDTGTIDFSAAGMGRLEGTFLAEGFEYGGAGPTGRSVSATDGAFDLPVVDDGDEAASGAPAGAAPSGAGLGSELKGAARRLAERRPRR